MATTVADIASPPYSATVLDFLWIIANNAEGNTISETPDQVALPSPIPVELKFLYVIANNGTDGGGIVLSSIAYDSSWPTDTELLYYIANTTQGNSPAFALSSIVPKDSWPVHRKLLYLIAQGVGVTSPLDIADIVDRPDWSTETQLYYVMAVNGVELSPITTDLAMWHKYLPSETVSTRSVDYAGNGYRGTLKTGTNLQLDGVNDNVILGTAINQDTGTWSMTFRQTSSSSAQALFGCEPADSKQFLFYMDGSNIYVRNGANSQTSVFSRPFSIGTTYHLAITISSDTVTVYVDGVFYDSAAIGSAGGYFFKTLGSHNNLYWFPGMIGGVKVFNQVLDADQVLELYEQPEQILPTGIVATDLELYMPMVEGAGTTIYDGSSNSNNGTLAGGVWNHEQEYPWMQVALIDWNEGGSGEILPVRPDGNDLTGTAISDAKFTNGLNLDGRSSLTITKGSEISFSSATTLELWIKVKKDQKNPAFSSLPTLPSLEFGSDTGQTVYYDYVHPTPSVSSSYTSGAVGSDVMHIVLVCGSDGSHNILYINGSLERDHVYSPIANLGNTVYTIGSNGTNYMFGEIMVLRIYSEQFSATQVAHNYNSECEDFGLSKI